MQENEIDVEKDYLVIITYQQGRFHRFNWFPADKFSLAEIEAKIADYNRKHKESEEKYTAELITDKLTKQVCAYMQLSKPFEDLIKDAKEVQENIDKAQEYLEYALDEINLIRGLG